MMETRCQPRNELFGNENILFPNNASFPQCGYLFPHFHRVIHISDIPIFLFRIPAGCHSINDNSPRGRPPLPRRRRAGAVHGPLAGATRIYYIRICGSVTVPSRRRYARVTLTIRSRHGPVALWVTLRFTLLPLAGT